MNYRILFLSALLVAVPASSLLPGCGGGVNSGIALGTYTSTLALSPTPTGFLTLTTGGGSSVARGTLRVASSGADTKSPSAFTLAIPNGTYQLSGTFSPPNSFSVQGSFPGIGPFFVSGQIPANGGNGNYLITASGQTANGNFAIGNATATPRATTTGTPGATATTLPTTPGTPAATSTPIPATTGNNRVENILFSNVSGANAGSVAPFTATITGSSFFKNDGGGFVGTAFFQTTGTGITRKLTFEGPQRAAAVSAGEVFSLGTGGQGSALALFYSETGSNGVERSWQAQSGTYTVVSGDANRVDFSVANARMAPAFNAGGAIGQFSLNGRGNVGK